MGSKKKTQEVVEVEAELVDPSELTIEEKNATYYTSKYIFNHINTSGNVINDETFSKSSSSKDTEYTVTWPSAPYVSGTFKAWYTAETSVEWPPGHTNTVHTVKSSPDETVYTIYARYNISFGIVFDIGSYFEWELEDGTYSDSNASVSFTSTEAKAGYHILYNDILKMVQIGYFKINNDGSVSKENYASMYLRANNKYVKGTRFKNNKPPESWEYSSKIHYIKNIYENATISFPSVTYYTSGNHTISSSINWGTPTKENYYGNLLEFYTTPTGGSIWDEYYNDPYDNPKEEPPTDTWIAPNGPSISGKSFIGWSKTKSATVAEIQAGASITLNNDYFKYYPVYQDVTTITYDNNGHGGTPPEPITNLPLGKHVLVEPELNPMADAFPWYFKEWWYNGRKANYGDEVSGDVVLVAQWTEADKYTITYNKNGHGSTQPDPIIRYTGYQLRHDEEVDDLPNLTDNDYIFVGWFDSNGNPVIAGKIIDSNIELIAHWVRMVHIQYISAHGTQPAAKNTGTSPYKLTEENNDLPELTDSSPWKFLGWYYDENYTRLATYNDEPSIEDIILYAKWTDKNLYYINYFSEVEAEPRESKRVEDGYQLLAEDIAILHNADLVNIGWFNAETGEQYLEGYEVHSDILLTAVWVDKPWLRYSSDPDGGKPADKKLDTIPYLITKDDIPDLEKYGFRFEGWYYTPQVPNEKGGDV